MLPFPFNVVACFSSGSSTCRGGGAGCKNGFAQWGFDNLIYFATFISLLFTSVHCPGSYHSRLTLKLYFSLLYWLSFGCQVDPPILLSPVASFLWPSLILLQFLLQCFGPTGSHPCDQQYPPRLLAEVCPFSSFLPPPLLLSCPPPVCIAGRQVIVCVNVSIDLVSIATCAVRAHI